MLGIIYYIIKSFDMLKMAQSVAHLVFYHGVDMILSSSPPFKAGGLRKPTG